ncbi:ABC transporter substrate-binding protein [Nostoc sp. ChiQUE01b]|uniref:sugar ABC transporter substrate-binding protein n=1 Tax=Nostoc sp. ChiQUE01b TaxID=3075376 RepID=UPI002AD2EA8C|nr:ABC transporter substrate-binding protein [Nostoc sp. ChiQUE01b]MDZ8259972.1 ABC transporter substrate-binding protein [Nostoc sp. ChiQUE01b]
MSILFRTKANPMAKGFKNQQRVKQTFTVMLIRASHRYVLVALILSLIILAYINILKSNQSLVIESPINSKILKIWSDKGYTLEEDEALQKIISNWEQQSGNKIKLTFYTNDELPQKTQRALQAGNSPDMVINSSAERELYPRLAWEGKLADVSDVIEPVKSIYSEGVLEAVRLYNNVDKKLSYYAVPINQLTIHIFYWRDLLEKIGRTQSDIPKKWDAFWEFWKQVQDDLRAQQKQNIYGLGFPFSTGSTDTYYLFEQILEAYDVQILDSNGQLLLNDPKMHQGIVESLEWYAKFFQQGYVPPDAVNWLNPDNNRSLLNRGVVMTPNSSLSIPAAVRQDPDTYRNKLGILEFPNKPNGKPMRHLVSVNEIVLFAESKNQKVAKDFLAYLIKPEIIGNYLKATGGRYLPVMKSVWKDPFWTNPADPHLSTATQTLTKGLTRPFYIVQNPAYSLVLEENVWGKALNQIVVNSISPEEAADMAIERIKQIFNEWQ